MNAENAQLVYPNHHLPRFTLLYALIYTINIFRRSSSLLAQASFDMHIIDKIRDLLFLPFFFFASL